MKMIIAVIRPERLEAVEDALRAVLDEGDNFRLTTDTVHGHGRQVGQVELYRGQELKPRLVTKTRITVCVNDQYVEKTIEAILLGGRSPPAGVVGDGKIFVVSLEETVRIRTGERGPSAI
jgi:nitrogen regulatory protein P-II 2